MKPIKYEVRYGKYIAWHKLKDIVEDGFIPDQHIRWFVLKNGSRIEIPTNNIRFIFSSKRMDAVRVTIAAAEKQKEHERITGNG